MSKLRMVCEGCGAEREVDEKLAGTVLVCSNCEASIRVPLPDIGEGSVIGGFILEKQLGFGSMGEVWLAYQKTLNRKVALKLLSQKFTLDSQFVDRFLKEVQISAKMDHPNMVTAFDAGCDNDIYYLAITFVDGMTLEDKLEAVGVFNEKEAIKVILDIASALKYAWDEFQIIHRDIKPANIMIDHKGVGKLMDLGISKNTSEEANLTMTGTIIGTPYYMSPEQGIGDKNLDFHTDIYSLGATLYHLVTGEVPFQATTALGIVSKHITEPFPPPQDKNPHVSDECSALLETMMAKECTSRQDSWDAVISDMKLVLSGEFPTSKRPKPGDSLVMRASSASITENEEPAHSKATVANPIPVQNPEDLGSNIFAGSEQHPTGKAKSKMPLIIGAAVVLIVLGAVLSVMVGGLGNNQSEDLEICTPDIEVNKDVPEIQETTVADNNSGQKAETSIAKKEDIKPLKETVIEEKPEPQKVKLKAFEDMWNFASDFAKKNPDKFDLAIANYQEISTTAGGTKYKMMADIEIAKLKKGKIAAVENVIKQLNSKSAPLEKKQDYSAAAALYSNYTGQFAEETAPERKKAALRLTALADALEKEAQKREDALKERQSKFYSDLAAAMFAGNWEMASKLVSNPPDKVEVPERTDTLLKELLNMDKALFSNIKKSIGKTLYVDTVNGRQAIKIKRIKGSTIYIEEKKGRVVIQKKFPISQLTPPEKAKRAGLSENATALYLASDAFHNKKIEAGFRYLKNIKGKLPEIMITAGKERLAELTFMKFLKKLNPEINSLEPEVVIEHLKKKEFTMMQRKKISAAIRLYKRNFATTQFAKDNEPLLALLESAEQGDDERENDRPEHDRQDMHKGEIKRINEVKGELERVNREYNGEGEFFETRGGHIVAANLSGVPGIDNRSLTVLRRLKLLRLDLSRTDIDDISLLKGLQLDRLNLSETRVRNLSPLKEMKSLKKLLLLRTEIDSLEPLKDLRLEVLDIAETRVNDIDPLRGMPLKALRLFNCPIRDFSPLSRCKSLVFLDPWDTWRMIPGKEYKADKPPKRVPKKLFDPIDDFQPRDDDNRNRDPDFRNDRR